MKLISHESVLDQRKTVRLFSGEASFSLNHTGSSFLTMTILWISITWIWSKRREEIHYYQLKFVQIFLNLWENYIKYCGWLFWEALALLKLTADEKTRDPDHETLNFPEYSIRAKKLYTWKYEIWRTYLQRNFKQSCVLRRVKWAFRRAKRTQSWSYL